jgi:glycosyltransferase involved in cell wall biosynthesis
MRVLRIYHSAVVDEYRHRERLLRERHGHDVHVVCPPAWVEGGSLVRATHDSRVPVHVVTVHGRREPNLFWYDSAALRAVIQELRPEIVDLHEEPYSLAAAGVLRAMRRMAPQAQLCVYTAQNLPRRYPPPFSGIELRVLARASAAYPCSSEAGDRLRARGFEAPIHVLPLGVTIPPLADRPAGPLRIGFVGRLEPYKGALIAIRAFAAVCGDSGAIMEVIGAGSQEDELRREAYSLGIRDAVQFLGAVSQEETLRRMNGLDLVLVPSLTTRTWKEQFGRVPVQAMAHGAVVIASDSGSLREVVADCGVLVEEGSQERFNAALRSLIAEPLRLKRLRDAGRARAVTDFSWEAVSDGVDKMYDRTQRVSPATSGAGTQANQGGGPREALPSRSYLHPR